MMKNYILAVKTNKGTYTCKFKWDEKDKAYIISVPSLPEVFTFGKNLTDAKKMVKDAIELYCDCLINEKKIIIDDERRVFGKLPSKRVISVA